VRQQLEERLADKGAEALHGELAEADPVAAQSILPTNGRRIVRALEVVALTGRPFSATLPIPSYVVPTVQIGLRLDRDELDARTDARVDRMWSQGFVGEVERLAAHGLRTGRTASRAVGYAQVLAALDGRSTLAEARAQTAQATRRLVRRQESWFGRDDRITWLAADAPDLLDRALRAASARSGAPDRG
jgi:tRNA dimethylallyltransferase